MDIPSSVCVASPHLWFFAVDDPHRDCLTYSRTQTGGNAANSLVCLIICIRSLAALCVRRIAMCQAVSGWKRVQRSTWSTVWQVQLMLKLEITWMPGDSSVTCESMRQGYSTTATTMSWSRASRCAGRGAAQRDWSRCSTSYLPKCNYVFCRIFRQPKKACPSHRTR